MRIWFVGLLLSLIALPAYSAHITDKLVVGLYEKPALKGEPLQLLTSGTPIEVLEKKGEAAKVRLADETQGWIEAGYVTEEKPASMMLLEAQAELRQLKAQMGGDAEPGQEQQSLQQELDAARERIARLEEGQADLLAARMAQSRLEDLRERVQQAVDLLGAKPSTEKLGQQQEAGFIESYLAWLVGFVMLVVGFVGGAAFIDYRVRKKFGGIRI